MNKLEQRVLVTAIPEGLRECAREGCHTWFLPKRSDHKYCDPYCRVLVNKTKHKETKS